MERDLGQRVGCMVGGVSVLAVAFVGLLAFYISQTGALPFTFRDGPSGIPPWAPLVVLLAITFGAARAHRARALRADRAYLP